MRILILAGHPFGGLRGRQQQIAFGLATAGRTVLYVDPFPAEEPGAGQVLPAWTTREESGVRVLGLAAAPSQPAPATESPAPEGGKTAFHRWSRRVGLLLEEMNQGDLFRSAEAPASRPAAFDLALVYPPALLTAAREALKVPIVFDCEEDFPSTAGSRALADAYEAALNEGLPLVDGLIAVNRYLVESWGRLLRPGVPRAVIEHGADLDLFQPPDEKARAQARRDLAVPPAARVAAYVGRLDARVSYEDLSEILEEEKTLLLLLLGEVNDEGRAILERLPSDRVITRGPLPQERVAHLLAAADLILVPLRREPHLEPQRGLTLYEYLATGLPVVGTFRRATKAFRDLFYLYATREELGAALQAALAETRDAPVRAARVAAAREADWGRRVRAVEELFAQVLQAARR